jgi:hypothetical protein
MVEHLEICSPAVFVELDRWKDILWDDYLYYKQLKTGPKKMGIP